MKVKDIISIVNENDEFLRALSEFKCYDGNCTNEVAMQRHKQLLQSYLNWLESEIPYER